jgi:hypothetical protein
MYLALRRPWSSQGTPPGDAGVVAMAPSDAGVAKPKKRPHGHHRGGGGGGAAGQPQSGDDSGWGGPDTVEETEAPLVQLTAGDRALEWRGDDTSPPKQTIDMNSGAESRSLDNGEIQSTFASQSQPVQTCVMQAATNTDLKGTINIKMVVDGSGRVTRSKLEAPHYMLEHGLLACVHGALGRVHFPATGAATLVTLPVNFN